MTTRKNKSLADGEITGEAPLSRGEQTRALILETALGMFSERGYEETTMRAVAEKAGVALGNTYYHFRSKEHLIQAFYERLHQQHKLACAPVLETERTLKGRLDGVMRAIMHNMQPWHRFAAVLFRTAADPQSPLNPFSAESAHIREESITWFADVLKGTRTKIPDDLAAELPSLLWLYQMSIVLFWIHDSSEGQRRTWRLLDHSLDIVTRMITLASNPLMKPLRKSVLDLVRGLREEVA
ncbi:MAG: TetR family transcriptional regulator [Blastocatellia bacterium]